VHSPSTRYQEQVQLKSSFLKRVLVMTAQMDAGARRTLSMTRLLELGSISLDNKQSRNPS
jgi:hypothetical protein